MGHDEASAGLLHHVTDTHLADRARLGEGVALDELLRRHGDTVARFATVVGTDTELAVKVVEQAFADAFDQIGSGGYSIEDPFLPGLLRSTRELTLRDAGSPSVPAADLWFAGSQGDERTEELVWLELAEAERSVVWLTSALAMDDQDIALVMDVDEDEVDAIGRRAAATLSDRIGLAAALLTDLDIDLPPDTLATARATWRTWVATVDGIAVPAPAADDDDDRIPLIARIEPVATRILRGAAVVLLLAGASAFAYNSRSGGGSSDAKRPAQVASADRGGSSSKVNRIAAPDLGGEIDLATATKTAAPPTGTSVLSATADASRAGAANGSSAGRTTAGGTSGGGSTVTPAGGAPAPAGGGGGTPAPPTGGGTPPPAGGGGTPVTPPAPGGGGGPVTPPSPTPDPSPAPTPTPTIPANPVTPVITTVTGTVGGVLGPLG